jgi:hypothetical protein
MLQGQSANETFGLDSSTTACQKKDGQASRRNVGSIEGSIVYTIGTTQYFRLPLSKR